MAITPATRVSKVLHKGGLPTTEPGSGRQGNKVRNTGSGTSLTTNRRLGSPTVSVSADFDLPSLAEERIGQIMTILKAAGYRVERHPSPEAHIVYVWEPNWLTYLDEVGWEIARGKGLVEEQPVAWRADQYRDGQILIHLDSCPKGSPRKSVPVYGRTLEDVTKELIGQLLPKTTDPNRRLRFVRLHDCITVA